MASGSPADAAPGRTGKHAINYRHVIDSLVRKPGAFENYQYREDMFPTSHFRMAYDWSVPASQPARGGSRIPEDPAAGGPRQPGRGAGRAAAGDRQNAPISAESIRLAVEQHQQVPPVTDVAVEAPDLQEFDSLLQHPDMEVDPYEYESNQDASRPNQRQRRRVARRGNRGRFQADDERVDRAVSGASPADVPRALRRLAEQAVQESAESHEYLSELTDLECQARRESRIARLMHQSRLPSSKTWSNFKWTRLPLQVARQMESLRDGSFLDRRENLLLFGKPGSGKSHCLCALGEQLVHRGRSILFTTCSLLVQQLLIAKRDLRLAKVIKRLSRSTP